MADEDRFAIYRRLRRDAPVLAIARAGGGREFLLTRYADVEAVLKDDRASVDRMRSPLFRDATDDLPPDLHPDAQNPSMLTLDPPAHTRLRRLVAGAFTPRRIGELEPRIRAHAEALAGALPRDEPFDLKARFAAPLPAIVIAELLGVPPADHARFRGWSDAILAYLLGEDPDPGAFRVARDGLRRFLRESIEHRRAEPRDDLIGAMIDVQEGDDERLSDEEMVGTCQLLLVAGHDTTSHWIASTLVALLREPERQRRLADAPDGLPDFLEEVLRLESPFQAIARIPTEDLELPGGERLTKGALVTACLGAANRDPDVFDDPDALRPGRDDAHLAFAAGRHFCLGATLARLETRIAVEVLVGAGAALRSPASRPPRIVDETLTRRIASIPARFERG